jgi:catechol 2,3-dioxygenase-like lactoylglutathione lyase family enzyme
MPTQEQIMPVIASILETSLYVEDMERSIAFYQALFEFPVILREARISTLRVTEQSVLLLFKQGGSINRSTDGGGTLGHDAVGQSHVAFAIAAADLNEWVTRLAQNGIAIESEMDWPNTGGSHSIYFRDPDQHLLELVTPGLWSMSW